MSISFSMNASKMSNALHHVKKIVSDTTQDLCELVITKNTITIVMGSAQKGTTVTRKLHVKVSGLKSKKVEIALNVGVFAGICYNRGELDFSIDSELRKVSFTSSGSYKGTVKAEKHGNPASLTDVTSEEGVSMSFGKGFRNLFIGAMEAVNISDTFGLGAVLDAEVQVTSKTLEVLVADQYHGAYTSIDLNKKGKHNKVQANFPIQYMATLKSYFKDDKEFSILITSTTLHAWSEDNTISLPLLKSDRVYSMSEFKQNMFTDDLKVQCSYIINANTMENILSNAESLFSGETQTMHLTASNKGLKLRAESSFGSINEGLKIDKVVKSAKKPVKISMEISTVLDLLYSMSSSKKEATLSIANNGKLLILSSVVEGQRKDYVALAYTSTP